MKIIGNKIYRLNYKTKCITIKGIKKSVNGWEKGSTMLVAYNDSPLYDALSSGDLDVIEDFTKGESKEKNLIKVSGTWYNFYGDPAKD